MRCGGGDGRVWWRGDTLILRVAITIELQLYRGKQKCLFVLLSLEGPTALADEADGLVHSQRVAADDHNR